MANNILGNLIRYIVSEVQDADGIIYRTRLVKLLYLCDVENYQSRGVLLTGLNWIRYKYGPYAVEFPTITSRMGLDIGEEELDFSSGRGVKYDVDYVPDPEKWLEAGQKLIIDGIIKRWGNEELRLLLDFVYCDTEPMKNAQFRQQLDFRKIPRKMRRSSSDSLDLSSGDQEAIKALLGKRQDISRPATILKPSNLKIEKKDDEPYIPPMSGTIKFKDTNSIRMYEGDE